MDRVLNTNDDVKSKFEDKFSSELSDIKNRHQRELELAKNNLQDIYEQKVSYYKEAKEDNERRITRLDQDLRDKTKQYDDVLIEFRHL
jgi:hypothetical protein